MILKDILNVSLLSFGCMRKGIETNASDNLKENMTVSVYPLYYKRIITMVKMTKIATTAGVDPKGAKKWWEFSKVSV